MRLHWVELFIFYTLYFAASLILPIAMAVLLSMLLAPVVQVFEKLLPRAAASALVVLSVLRLLGAGVALLTGRPPDED